jgi:glycosyltransferase involved in cell wall biosynthesis
VTITIALPFINLTGGIRVLLDYANALHDAGHRVTVVYPRWPYRFQYTRQQQWGEFKKHLAHDRKVPWFTLRANLSCVPLIRSWSMPRADIVIAAGWPVAHDVSRLSRSCGRRVLIVFHHESGTGSERRIRDVYDLPFYRIAFSSFVRESITRDFGCEIHDVVPNGVDSQIFFPDGVADKPSVLFLYHPDPRKGAADGLAALTALRSTAPDAAIRICGTVQPAELPADLPFEFHPGDAALRRYYSQSTVLLYPSRYEGFALPPLEAMACGCPSVTTRVGAVAEYARDGTTSTFVDSGDVTGMTSALLNYLGDRELRSRHSIAGITAARRYSLQRVAPLFAAALQRAATA